jgi:hypothetical protein
MSKAKFAAAKELIDEKKYDEARAILRTIDHPTAQTWLDKLDTIAPSEPKIFASKPVPQTVNTKSSKKAGKGIYKFTRGCLIIFAVLLVIYFITPKTSAPPAKSDPTFTEAERAGIASTSTAESIAFNATATVIALTPPTPTATITDTPLPTSTETPTITPTMTATPSTEDRARQIINEVLISDLERISITELGSPKLLAIDYPMAGLLNYNVDFTGREMLKIACALYKNGFAPGWRYQFSAMIDVVDKSTGKTSRRDGLSVRITSETVANWDCGNTDAMDAKFAVDEYILDPLLNN